ncbi:MAG: NAD(P)/FAD-dependent oxidoreductase [Elainella sp. Prado103]|nr:NAD(P)/FAD-dependent oxidoreductase [Elainella sp. Prado103]
MVQPAVKHWAIVGGGILGMVLAHRLVQQGQQVTLLESAPELGGLASAWTLADLVWDRHYHVTLLSDFHLRSLLQELGLEQEMRWVETKTGCYSNGRLYSVSNAIEFLQFPPLGWIDKLRLGWTILYASKIRDWRRLEQISVSEWLMRWSGRRTFQKFWLPLLRSKLGENYHQASAAFIWAIIARLYAARRTGLKKELFGYLPGGYARLLARFATVLQEEGVDLRLGHRVEQVRSSLRNLQPGQVEILFSDRASMQFDQVVLTTPAPVATRLCPDLSLAEQDRLQQIQYQGIICASILLKRPLSRFYVTNITDTWVPFTGVIEMTTLVDPQEFGGRFLVYLPKYVAPDDPVFNWSDPDLKKTFISALQIMYPDFDPKDILSFQISRVKYVLAISTLNYSQRLPDIHTSLPGVSIVNSAHITNGTLNVNETVQLAENVVPILLQRSQQLIPAYSSSATTEVKL